MFFRLYGFLSHFFHLSNYSIFIRIFFTILSIMVALWIINKKDNPAYKLAWIVPILLMPLLGGLMYLAIGNKNPTRRMRRRLEHSKSRIWPLVHQDGDSDGQAGKHECQCGRTGEIFTAVRLSNL